VKFGFAAPIADGRVSRPMADGDNDPVQVLVSTDKGTGLPGVTVTLSIFGNSSSIAFFKDGRNAAATSTVTRTTGPDGLATFDNVFLTKAGGYQLVAGGAFDGVAGTPGLSNSFTWQNK
jgi:hypothetical protein